MELTRVVGFFSKLCGVSACAAGFALLAPAMTQAADQTADFQQRFATVAKPNAVLTRVRVTVNKSDTIRLPHTYNEIMVGAPDIAEVIPLTDRTLYVLGKRLGTTNVTVLDETKRVVGVVDLEVTLDTRDIAAKVRAATGAGDIRVTSHGDKVVIGGTASDATMVDRAVSVASSLAPGGVINTTRVASPQQVMLQVRFIEVNRDAGRELGFRLEGSTRNAAARTGSVGFNSPLNSTGNSGRGLLSDFIPAVAGASASAMPFGQILGRFTGGSQKLDVIISALETKGMARRLAEPNLIALSGDSADFLAGGEYPIPVASTTQGGVPTITIAFKEFGIRLNFTPTVLANGVINLRLEPEVSEIDPSVSVNTGTIVVPGLSKRRARTTVELRDGQSFAVAGLLQATTQRNMEQFPWIGSVPVIGALFRSTEFQQRETELVVIVTPSLVKPAKPGTVIETPLDSTVPANDADLFVAGKLEIEKSGRGSVQEFIQSIGASAGPHGHILGGSEPLPPPPAVVRAKN
jgi:pilus assembly protein CpaC